MKRHARVEQVRRLAPRTGKDEAIRPRRAIERPDGLTAYYLADNRYSSQIP